MLAQLRSLDAILEINMTEEKEKPKHKLTQAEKWLQRKGPAKPSLTCFFNKKPNSPSPHMKKEKYE